MGDKRKGEPPVDLNRSIDRLVGEMVQSGRSMNVRPIQVHPTDGPPVPGDMPAAAPPQSNAEPPASGDERPASDSPSK
jgi:hypothetical protein